MAGVMWFLMGFFCNCHCWVISRNCNGKSYLSLRTANHWLLTIKLRWLLGNLGLELSNDTRFDGLRFLPLHFMHHKNIWYLQLQLYIQTPSQNWRPILCRYQSTLKAMILAANIKPVSVGIDADSEMFVNYTSGITGRPAESAYTTLWSRLVLEMMLPHGNYWLVRNSRGEKVYVRIGCLRLRN